MSQDIPSEVVEAFGGDQTQANADWTENHNGDDTVVDADPTPDSQANPPGNPGGNFLENNLLRFAGPKKKARGPSRGPSRGSSKSKDAGKCIPRPLHGEKALKFDERYIELADNACMQADNVKHFCVCGDENTEVPACRKALFFHCFGGKECFKECRKSKVRVGKLCVRKCVAKKNGFRKKEEKKQEEEKKPAGQFVGGVWSDHMPENPGIHKAFPYSE